MPVRYFGHSRLNIMYPRPFTTRLATRLIVKLYQTGKQCTCVREGGGTFATNTKLLTTRRTGRCFSLTYLLRRRPHSVT